ncbi:MAG: bifunctional enoyl-CoA hydratase/phosphate acetyltransferase [Bacteroidota bacterium]
MIKKLDDLLKTKKAHEPRKLVVAAAEDIHVLEAVKEATKLNLIKPTLIGERNEIARLCKEIDFNAEYYHLVNVQEADIAAEKAVRLVHEGKADILMKGYISTETFLKAVLHKNFGLLDEGLLSHIAVFESPYYRKLLGVTDAAMNINPDIPEKAVLINNAVTLFTRLGVTIPKVAVLAAIENVNPKMEATLHAAQLSIMNKRGQIKNCVVDGPLALDNAVSKEAAKHKCIKGTVAGQADILIAPDINAGNVLYKSLNFLGGASVAALVMGAKAPIVLTSRADSKKSKLLSIALATFMENPVDE